MPATVPAQFSPDDWLVTTGLAASQIVLNVSALPADGGSAITALQYRVDGGVWTALAGTGTGARTLTMAAAGTSYDIEVRAVNAVDAGPASASKSATSGESDGIVYEQSYATNRSADFTGAALTHDPALTYFANGASMSAYKWWRGGQLPGAMVFGAGLSSTTDVMINWPVQAADVYEVYALISRLATWNSVNYSGYDQLDLYTSWRDAGGAIIGAETRYASLIGPQQIALTAPAGAVTLRMRIVKLSVAGSNCPMGIFHLLLTDMTGRGIRPTRTTTPLMARAQYIGQGLSKTLDFAGAFADATTLEYGGAEPDVVSGSQITITADAIIATPEERAVYGKAGSLTAHGAFVFYLMSTAPPALALSTAASAANTYRPVFNHVVERGGRVLIDTLSHIDRATGVWPYECEVIAAPVWLEEANNGVLTGIAPDADSVDTITVRVTDQRGDIVDVTRTLTIRPAWPTTPDYSPAAGTIGAPTDIKVAVGNPATNAPKVIQLAAGHYAFGNWYGFNRNPANPIIIRGAGIDQTFLVGQSVMNAASGFIFEDLTMVNAGLPSSPNTLDGSTGRHWAVFWGTTSNAVPVTAQTRLHRVKAKGFRAANMAAETVNTSCYRVRNVAPNVGKLVWANNPATPTAAEIADGFVIAQSLPPDDAWVVANYPDLAAKYGYYCYNGGFRLDMPTVLEDCEAEDSAMPLAVQGTQIGVFGFTSRRSRVDALRVWHCEGVVIDGYVVDPDTHGGNHRADEHRDMMQTAAPANQYLPKRVTLRNSVLTSGIDHAQAYQGNVDGASNASLSYSRAPWIGSEDFRVEHTVFGVADMANLVNAVFGEFSFDRCVLVRSPLVPVAGVVTLNDGLAVIRAGNGVDMTLTDSIITSAASEQGGILSVSGNVGVTSGNQATIFPYIADTGLSLLDRLRIDADWAITNTGVGPEWLIDVPIYDPLELAGAVQLIRVQMGTGTVTVNAADNVIGDGAVYSIPATAGCTINASTGAMSVDTATLPRGDTTVAVTADNGTNSVTFDVPLRAGPAFYLAYPDNEIPTNEAARNAEFALLSGAGIRGLRIDLRWGDYETSQGVYNFAPLLARINSARAQNWEITFVVHGPVPSYARPGGSSDTRIPTNSTQRAGFANFVAAAQAYFPDVNLWEIWNEPNWTFMDRTSTATELALLTIAASTALKAANPNAFIISGGLSNVGTTEGSGVKDTDFLTEMFAVSGFAAAIDAVGYHPYSWHWLPSDTDGWTGWQMMRAGIRTVMATAGASGKPVWPTEAGMPTGGLDREGDAQPLNNPTRQATTLLQSFDLGSTYSWCGPIFWYSAKDRDPSGASESTFGLIEETGVEKPAMDVLRELHFGGQTVSLTIISAPLDTFTAADGTLLSAHTSDSGHDWTVYAGMPTIGSNGIYAAGGAYRAFMEHTPALNCYAKASVRFNDASEDQAVELMLRGTSDGNTYYSGGIGPGGTDGNVIFFGRVVAGTFNAVGTSLSIPDFTVGTTHDIEFRVSGSAAPITLQLWIDGVMVHSATNNTSPITAAGRPGIKASIASTATTKRRVESFEAGDL